MYGTRYESLEDMLVAKREWVALEEVVDTVPRLEVRPDLVEKWLLKAVSVGDDDKALDYGLWLVRAMEDVEYLPLTGFDQNLKVKTIDERAPEVVKVRQNLLRSKASRFMKLWKQLPHDGKGLCRVQDTENESHFEPIRMPVLLKTRKAFLSEIAACWRESTDEMAASECLEFLLELDLGFQEEVKVLEEVFREATKPGFPSRRLLLDFETIVDKIERRRRGRFGDVVRIVAIACGRNTESKVVARILQAVGPVLEAGEAAFRALGAYAEALSALRFKALKLEAALVENTMFRDCSVDIWYPPDGGIEVIVAFPPAYRSNFDRAKANARFAKKRQVVEAWRKENPGIPVRLKMIVPCDHGDKPLAVQEQRYA